MQDGRKLLLWGSKQVPDGMMASQCWREVRFWGRGRKQAHGEGAKSLALVVAMTGWQTDSELSVNSAWRRVEMPRARPGALYGCEEKPSVVNV